MVGLSVLRYLDDVVCSVQFQIIHIEATFLVEIRLQLNDELKSSRHDHI